MCGHQNSEKFRTVVRKIRDEKTTAPAVILSNHADIPKPELFAQAEEHPENWIIFFTKYLKKGQNRRALRLDTNGSIIISDDELLTEITEKTVLYPAAVGFTRTPLIRYLPEKMPEAEIPEETVFLYACGMRGMTNYSGDNWICAGSPSIPKLRNKLLILYLQKKQIKCRLIEKPDNPEDEKSFEELRNLCRELQIPVRKIPEEKSPFEVNQWTEWALRLILFPFEISAWERVLRTILKNCIFETFSTEPRGRTEELVETIFSYYVHKRDKGVMEYDKNWLPYQKKWQEKMSENVFRKITTILPAKFLRTDPDGDVTYDTIVIGCGVRGKETFPNRAEYIRVHKTDFIRAGWTCMEYAFSKYQNRKRAIPLPFLAPVSLRFFAHADLLEITFKLKNRLCTGTAGGKTEKTEE